MNISFRKTLALFTLSAIAFSACSEKQTMQETQNARLQVRLTDSPDPNVREVWVDIQQVQINMDDSTGDSWVSLTGANPGVYNLLELTNGRDTLLADAEIPAGQIGQIRLVLGPNNYVILNDGTRKNLTTPSAQQSGLKVNVNQLLTGGSLYRLILDFDAGRSVIRAGNSGQYILKPVLRLLSLLPSGGILQGVITPDSIRTGVYALNGVDTIASTFTDTTNGEWSISDIPGGSYNLVFQPNNTNYQSTNRTVQITPGQTTLVDTVHLQ